MRFFISVILRIVNIISLGCTGVFVAYCMYEEIMGPVRTEKLLEYLHIPLSYNQVFIVGFVCFAIMVISYILIQKLLGRPL